jgi:hypothetical protein
MKTQILLLSSLLICLFGFYEPVTTPTGKGAPAEAEVRAWFTKYNADWCQSHGYVNPTTTFSRIQLAAATRYNFIGVGAQTCYPVKLDWTAAYADVYRKQRFTDQTVNDFFRFYRDDFGELAIGDHTPGQLTSQNRSFD